jgi:hypothetical protein
MYQKIKKKLQKSYNRRWQQMLLPPQQMVVGACRPTAESGAQPPILSSNRRLKWRPETTVVTDSGRAYFLCKFATHT